MFIIFFSSSSWVTKSVASLGKGEERMVKSNFFWFSLLQSSKKFTFPFCFATFTFTSEEQNINVDVKKLI